MEGYNKWWSTVSIALKDGRRVLVDGHGFFCIRTKGVEAVYYFQMDKKDFAELSMTWNDIRKRDP